MIERDCLKLNTQEEDGMAKGQMRSTREKKKPKQDKNKKKKGASPFTGYAEKGTPGQGAVPKKTP